MALNWVACRMSLVMVSVSTIRLYILRRRHLEDIRTHRSIDEIVLHVCRGPSTLKPCNYLLVGNILPPYNMILNVSQNRCQKPRKRKVSFSLDLLSGYRRFRPMQHGYLRNVSPGNNRLSRKVKVVCAEDSCYYICSLWYHTFSWKVVRAEGVTSA